MNRKRTAVLAAAVVLVMSMALPAVSAGLAVAQSHAATGAAASALTASAATKANVALTPATIPTSPHPGILNVYTIAPGGATSEDPAIAYDTVSYEPILNTYETLVNYNGSNTATFVPTLATCVPGTPQCVTDYGTNLTGFVGSQPIYWTFVIDPVAQFYDPTTAAHWGVYPSDVAFSVARTLAFMDLPGVGSNNGWILGQSLLPLNGTGIHAPYNNIPYEVLSSMYINDTNYCPAAALTHAHGCITFNASGGGQDWPYFLQLVADNLGASVEPCGWFTAESAGVPGWPGSAALHGDGPCLLPGNAHNTSDASFQTFLHNPATGNSPTYWDAFENLASGSPFVQPNVIDHLVGSGPYAAQVDLSTGYSLSTNPNYAQPSACNPSSGLAQYIGYCDPAPNTYAGTVHVTYTPDSTATITGFQTGAIDFGGFETADTGTILNLQSHGKLALFYAPEISNFFFPYALEASHSAFTSDGFSGGYSIPGDLFSNDAARQLLDAAYPHTTVENTLLTVDGVQYGVQTGGPIPQHMGDYYPANVSFRLTNPDLNPAHVGSAAWWAAQSMNVTASPYYDPALANCKNVTCVFPIAGEVGAGNLNTAIGLWSTSIKLVTDGALQPYIYNLTFHDLIHKVLFAAPGHNPFPVWNLGWAPDYPDPTDYMVPMAYPDATYTYSDALSEQLLGNVSFNDPLCLHQDPTLYSSLVYWANQAQITNQCQGFAYNASYQWNLVAGALPTGAQRTLDYNLIEHILNALNIMTWYDQANGVGAAAPWIDNTTVNTDPMIGGGGDQPWYQIGYVGVPTSALFHAAGLKAGTSWSVTLSGVGTKSALAPATISFTGLTTGRVYGYSVGIVGGYFPYVAPNKGTAVYSGTFTAKATVNSVTTHWLVYKGYSIVFNPNSVLSSGLPITEKWQIAIQGAKTVKNMTGGTIVVTGIANGTLKYTITAKGFHSTYPTPMKGTFTEVGGTVTFPGGPAVPGTAGSPPTVNVTFTQPTTSVTFTSTTASGAWTVYLNSSSVLVCAAGVCTPYVNETMTGAGPIAFPSIVNGTYTYTVKAPVGQHVVGPVTGNIAVHGHPIVHVTHFAAGALPASPAHILAPMAVGQRTRELL